MSKKILVKFATRSRPEYFKACIANIHATVSNGFDFQILVTADLDDEKMYNDSIANFCRHFDAVKLVYGLSESKIHAINRDMEQAAPWDILVNMSDDFKFVKFGWDNMIRQKLKDHWPEGDAFIHFDDGFVKDALATMSIIDKKYYDRDGYVYYPEYKSFSCDAEAWFVARARGCHKYFSEIIATHQHPTHSPVPHDALYRKNSEATPHDLAVYWRRLNSNFGLEGSGPWPWDEFKNQNK